MQWQISEKTSPSPTWLYRGEKHQIICTDNDRVALFETATRRRRKCRCSSRLWHRVDVPVFRRNIPSPYSTCGCTTQKTTVWINSTAYVEMSCHIWSLTKGESTFCPRSKNCRNSLHGHKHVLRTPSLVWRRANARFNDRGDRVFVITWQQRFRDTETL